MVFQVATLKEGGEEHGALVQQILETQKELEEPKKSTSVEIVCYYLWTKQGSVLKLDHCIFRKESLDCLMLGEDVKESLLRGKWINLKTPSRPLQDQQILWES